jgi:hypothetical protein
MQCNSRYLILSLAARAVVGPKNADQAVLLLQQVLFLLLLLSLLLLQLLLWPVTRSSALTAATIVSFTSPPDVTSYYPDSTTLTSMHTLHSDIHPNSPHSTPPFSTSPLTCSTWWLPCSQERQRLHRCALLTLLSVRLSMLLLSVCLSLLLLSVCLSLLLLSVCPDTCSCPCPQTLTHTER